MSWGFFTEPCTRSLRFEALSQCFSHGACSGFHAHPPSSPRPSTDSFSQLPTCPSSPPSQQLYTLSSKVKYEVRDNFITWPYRMSAAAPTSLLCVPRHRDRTRLKVPEPSPVVALLLIRNNRAHSALDAVHISDFSRREVRKGFASAADIHLTYSAFKLLEIIGATPPIVTLEKKDEKS